jgi:hypothetical protein
VLVSAFLLAATQVIWSGTARVDVMIWEPGGEHPYTTDFTLEYSEEPGTPRPNGSGLPVARTLSLVPTRVAVDGRHQVGHTHGRPLCSGGGRDIVKAATSGTITILRDGSGRYQLVLPRAVGAFACGSKVNARDRQVVIGTGLFEVLGEVDAADAEARTLQANGSAMRGEYRSSDAARGGPVRHDYNVRWHIQRHSTP